METGSGDNLRPEAAKLLLAVSRHSVLDASHNLDGEKRNSGVHCGRTKVFLTQLMVSYWHTLHPHTLFKAFIGWKGFSTVVLLIWVFGSFIRPVKQAKRSGHVGALTCLAVVSQLDLLEDQRKEILSRCAFSIQCCWRRYQRRRHHTRQRSATLIQAGKLKMTRPGTNEWQSSVAPAWLSARQEPAGRVCTQCWQADRIYPFISCRTPNLIWLTQTDRHSLDTSSWAGLHKPLSLQRAD